MASDMAHDGGAWNLYNHYKNSDDIISQYWLKKSAQLGNEDAQLLLKTQIHVIPVNK